VFEIGNSLREARVRQGLDYTEIELATKVRAKYLQALEDEHFELLPAQPYVKGFLRTYAEFLGLDGQLYVDEYNSRYVVDAHEDIAPRRISPRARQHQRGLERRVLLLAIVGIAALTALVIVAWKFGGGTAATPPPAKQSGAPTTTLSGLKLKGVGKGTYVEIRRRSASGKVLFQGTINHGRAKLVPGSRFWIYVRRPSRVRVSLGGKAVALPARRNLRVIVTPTRTSRAPTG
jgi:cytoskeleton protein RodZ